RRFIALGILIAAAFASFPTLVLAQCGKERWAVKTGTDTDAALINPAALTATTIAALTSLPGPHPLPENNRVAPTANSVFVVNGTLTSYNPGRSSDYHWVPRAGAVSTIIGEIPAPTCVGSNSPFSAAIASARAKFNAQFSPTASFQSANIPVQVK